MTTERLFEFRLLAQTLHFGKAADKLYMAQSVLSRHIQDLERELGAALFVRGPHGVSLTTAGAVLLRDSSEFLRECTRAEERARSADSGAAGAVRFGCMRPIMSDAVENFLIYFTDRYPDVHLTAEVLDLLRPGEAEDFDFLAVSSNSVDIPEHFRLIETLKEEAWLLLPSDCWLRTGEAVSLAEIGGKTLFLPGYRGSSGAFECIRRLAEQATDGSVRIVRVPNPETAMLNVSLRRGCTILPRHRLEKGTRPRCHCAAIREECSFDMLLFRSERAEDAAAQTFADELTQLRRFLA